MEKALNVYAKGIGKIYRFLILHVLWLGFTVVGLGVLGVFPATYALFETVKEPSDLKGKEYFTIFKGIYIRTFWKMNRAGLIWQIMFLLMGMNLFIFYESHIFILITILGMLLLMTLCVIYFLEYFTMDMKILTQIKRSFGYVFLYPKHNVLFMVILFLLLIAINFSPGVTLFFGSSVTAFLFTKVRAV